MPKEEKQTKMPSSVPTKPFRGPGGGHGPRFQFEKVEIKDPLGTLKKLLRYLGRYKWRIIFAFFSCNVIFYFGNYRSVSYREGYR